MFIYTKNTHGLFTVYLITNKTNNKRYIGIHKEEPNEDLRKYMGSGRDLIDAIRNEGVENFDKVILARFDTREEMVSMEEQLVTEDIVESSEYYNLQTGGNHQIVSEDTRQKQSEAKKGKKHSKATLEKMREKKLGKKHSEAAREKQSEAKRGENHPMFGRTGENHPNAKHANIYCYKTDRLIADGVVIREYARNNGCHQGNLSVTTRADRTLPHHWKYNKHHTKGIYAEYIE